jgi:LPS O-antigen subunit length determinant protein (WzzB/FepE family)
MERDENVIDLKDLTLFVYSKKLIVLSSTFTFFLLAILYSLSSPNIYQSSSLLAPANEQDSLSSQLGSYSALAGLAGVSLPNDVTNSTTEAIERIKSFDFFSIFFLPNISKENLFALKKWDQESDTLIYNERFFNALSKKWVIQEPSKLQMYEKYKKILSISQDPKTSFVNLSIKSPSPKIARDWLNIIILNINESMREEDKYVASNSIDFLNENYNNTNLSEIREVISKLLQSQIQTQMLASANKDYIFKIIDSPQVAEKKSSPKRLLISLAGILLGLLISIFYIFAIYILKED